MWNSYNPILSHTASNYRVSRRDKVIDSPALTLAGFLAHVYQHVKEPKDLTELKSKELVVVQGAE
jgi:hypothetical protein